MSGQAKTFPGLMLTVAQAAAVCTILSAAGISGGSLPGYYPLALIPYALILSCADLLFLRKERTVAALSVLNGCFWVLLVVTAILSRPGKGVTQQVMLTMICAVPTIQAARICLKPPTLNSLILWTDISAVCLIFSAAVISLNTGVSWLWCAPAVLGLTAVLCGLISMRMEHTLLRRKLPVCLLAGALLVAAALLLLFAAEPAGKGITEAWNGLGLLLKQLWSLLERAAEAFARLFPQDHFEEAASIAETGIPNTAEYTDNSGQKMGYLLFYILTFAGAAALIAALFVFGRKLMKKQVGGNRQTAGRSTNPPVRAALRKWLAQRRKKQTVRAFLKANRYNSAGIYFYLEKLCAGGPLERRTGETPAMFLKRVAEPAADLNAEIDAALLVRTVDRTLFRSDSEPVELPFGEALCRQVQELQRNEKRKNRNPDESGG